MIRKIHADIFFSMLMVLFFEALGFFLFHWWGLLIAPGLILVGIIMWAIQSWYNKLEE